MYPNLSPSRLKILRIFYENPDSEFYALQVKKLVKMSYDRCYTYLREWERAGVLRSKVHGKKRIYTLNRKHPLTKAIFRIFEIGDKDR